MKSTLDLIDLSDKPASYRYTTRELAFIKKHHPKHYYKILYCLYKPTSPSNRYIGFLIDSMPYVSRRSGVLNIWEVIESREISNIEYEEVINNFGCNKRRFTAWYYKTIEQLIADDQKYNIGTPEQFIKKCKEKGYSGNYQLYIEMT